MRSRTDDLGRSRLRLDADEARVVKAVSDRIDNHRGQAASELRHYRSQASLARTIEMAARATRSDGEKRDHQRRIPLGKLSDLSLRLMQQKRQLRGARDFDELHELVALSARLIWNIAELTIYDTALRIGAYRGLLPTTVYLHRGTRDGARMQSGALEIGVGRAPREFETFGVIGRSVLNNQLGIWSTRDWPNGTYMIRVHVLDAQGRASESQVVLTAAN